MVEVVTGLEGVEDLEMAAEVKMWCGWWYRGGEAEVVCEGAG